ncbi:MAG: tRNA (adenosine(37)-N6)-threonylcarbamoyltransferase complex ATPase subunit type 1 TsaE [Myxococcota bacterium]
MKDWERDLSDAEATHAFGVELGAGAQPGTIFALEGELGAGKTALTRGIAEGWGVARLGEVVSPTYAIMFDHPAPRGRLVHIDLYRLDEPDSLLGLGVEEAIADPTALVVIEWANRIPSVIPEHAGWIRLAPSGSGRRAVIKGIARPQRG